MFLNADIILEENIRYATSLLDAYPLIIRFNSGETIVSIAAWWRSRSD